MVSNNDQDTQTGKAQRIGEASWLSCRQSQPPQHRLSQTIFNFENYSESSLEKLFRKFLKAGGEGAYLSCGSWGARAESGHESEAGFTGLLAHT